MCVCVSASIYIYFETPPGALCSSLGSPKQKGHGPIRMSPVEDHKDGQGAGSPLH